MTDWLNYWFICLFIHIFNYLFIFCIYLVFIDLIISSPIYLSILSFISLANDLCILLFTYSFVSHFNLPLSVGPIYFNFSASLEEINTTFGPTLHTNEDILNPSKHIKSGSLYKKISQSLSNCFWIFFIPLHLYHLHTEGLK